MQVSNFKWLRPLAPFRCDDWESFFLSLWRIGDTLRFDTGACDRSWREHLVAWQNEANDFESAVPIWPMHHTFYVPITRESLKVYWKHIKDLEPTQICDHFYVFDGETLVLAANEFGFRGHPLELSLQNVWRWKQKRLSSALALTRMPQGEAR